MKGWRPIETAPKNGTRVLVFTTRSVVGYYQEFAEMGWFSDDGRFLAPTHWMPLPEAPGKEKGSQSANKSRVAC